MDTIPTLVLLPPKGPSRAEAWVSNGLLAAGKDLVSRLLETDCYSPIYLLAGESDHSDQITALGAHPFPKSVDAFHFGEVFESFLEHMGWGPAAYFGGGCGPLLTVDDLGKVGERILTAERDLAVVNNYHSSDWIVLRTGGPARGLSGRLPADNMLGWVLDHEAGFTVEAAAASAATRADLDTPLDFVMLHGHPDLGPHLNEFLRGAPASHLQKVEQLKRIMSTPASQLALLGRVSPQVLTEIGRRCQIWTRVFSEERGMVASGRLERGEVVSLLAAFSQANGVDALVNALVSITDAVLWDTRVLLAANGGWPAAGERFALDLGWSDELQNPALIELATAIERAEIPIIHGGHGVVSGGLFAMLETLNEP